ncbi:MAG: DUF1554 domain-containing protein [Chloroflexota bacterium]|nr:DUF1554 domain-containing protein [Chloroflexota bacterium]
MRLDDLARAISRRKTLATIGALVTGFATAPTPLEARKRKKKKSCPPCRKRKKGKCKGKLPDGAACVSGTCSGGICVAACGRGGPCTVFLSSSTVQGNLGGLGGADTRCQSLAAAAGLAGTYRAWLSDATSSPSSRFVRSSGPYRLVNGVTIAESWVDLTDGSPLQATITVTETGGDHGGNTNAWSNTGPDGRALLGGPGTGHCVNWTSNSNGIEGGFGNISNAETWSSVPVTVPCVNYRHLYCFQQN